MPSLFVIWKITDIWLFLFSLPMSQRQIQGKTIAINSNIWMISQLWGIRLWCWVNAEGPFCLSSTLLCKVVSYSYNILTVSKVWVFLLDGWRHDQDHQPMGGILVQIWSLWKSGSHPTDGWQAAVERTSPYSPSASATLGELLCLSDSQSPHLLSRDKNNTSLSNCCTKIKTGEWN